MSETKDNKNKPIATLPLPNFACVVTADALGGIGRKGVLPWGSLQYERAWTYDTTTTTDKNISNPNGRRNIVIMGHNAWKSLPQGKAPMANRINVVISKDAALPVPDGVYVVTSLDEALARAAKLIGAGTGNRVFVMGGAKTLQNAFQHPKCTHIYLTHLLKLVSKCDVFVDWGPYFEPDNEYPRKVHAQGEWNYILQRLKRRAANGK